MYVKRDVRKVHFKSNKTFKVIQGHPYWCRQESRTVCGRNVQLMPTLFLKLTIDMATGKRQIRRFQQRFTFEDVPARNAFEDVQMVYIARN